MVPPGGEGAERRHSRELASESDRGYEAATAAAALFARHDSRAGAARATYEAAGDSENVWESPGGASSPGRLGNRLRRHRRGDEDPDGARASSLSFCELDRDRDRDSFRRPGHDTQWSPLICMMAFVK